MKNDRRAFQHSGLSLGGFGYSQGKTDGDKQQINNKPRIFTPKTAAMHRKNQKEKAPKTA